MNHFERLSRSGSHRTWKTALAGGNRPYAYAYFRRTETPPRNEILNNAIETLDEFRYGTMSK